MDFNLQEDRFVSSQTLWVIFLSSQGSISWDTFGIMKIKLELHYVAHMNEVNFFVGHVQFPFTKKNLAWSHVQKVIYINENIYII